MKHDVRKRMSEVFIFRGSGRDARRLQLLSEKFGVDKSAAMRKCLRYVYRKFIVKKKEVEKVD